MTESQPSRYPMLGQILGIQGKAIKPMYTTREVADIFNVTPRSIQHRIAARQLVPRDLPGRAKFLPQDIEDFLSRSQRAGNDRDGGERIAA